MKRFDLHVLFILIAALAVFCDSNYLSAQQKNIESEQSWESTVVDETSFNFGDVKPGTDTEKVVVLKNTSSKPYIIKSVSSSCGCMKAEMEPGNIEPGKSKKLTIKLNTERFLGHRSASIHVAFAQPANREIKIAGKVNIRQLACEPEEIQYLDLPNKKEEQTRKLFVKRTGSPFWKIKSIESSCETISAEIVNSQIEGKVVKYEIACVLMPKEGRRGIQNEKLTLRTNDSSMPSYEVPILIQHSARVKTSPALLNFSDAAVGKTKLMIVRFSEAAEPAFVIEKDSGFAVASSKKLNDRTWKLEIEKTGETRENAELRINSAGWETAERVKILTHQK